MQRKFYHGWRDGDGKAHVSVNDAPLNPRLELRHHSTAFEWGYYGSGPAQLALAILADALGNGVRALELHQRFKQRVIAELDHDHEWTLSGDAVLYEVSRIRLDVEAE